MIPGPQTTTERQTVKQEDELTAPQTARRSFLGMLGAAIGSGGAVVAGVAAARGADARRCGCNGGGETRDPRLRLDQAPVGIRRGRHQVHRLPALRRSVQDRKRRPAATRTSSAPGWSATSISKARTGRASTASRIRSTSRRPGRKKSTASPIATRTRRSKRRSSCRSCAISARIRPACRCARPARPTRPRTGWC